ncbi:hypothetical protein G7Y89_g8283 [Cudoniella acicularis]|uniref:ATP-grasp domain-containing protein n=1 Tax=Cudoniella acicularis TaxID=354080 RepID=A0A8H4W301_9HELO|nr:hypothetical protein G7Y89_g8283 [Cudoniella acicularis]
MASENISLPMDCAMVDILYASKNDGSRQLYSFSWRANAAYELFVVQSVDLVITPMMDGPRGQHTPELSWPRDLRSRLELGNGKSIPNIRAFLDEALQEDHTPPSIGVKLIIPTVNGYVAQSNIIEERLHGCPYVGSAVGFLQPGELVKNFSLPAPRPNQDKGVSIPQLYSLLIAAIGGIKSTISGSESPWEVLGSLENEFKNRLGLQFLLPEPIPRRRVGLVRCKDDRMSNELLLYLNIDLVIFDAPGHFMEDPHGHSAHLRASFHAIDLNPDDGFVQRLYLAARDLHLDGIITRFDPLLEKVAQVAELLQLPSAAPSAFAVATNKYLARMALPEDDQLQDQVRCVKTKYDLEQPLRITYPVVVKPTQGRSSFGVVKVMDESELLEAVDRAASFIVGCGGEINIHPDVMIEPYVDGPEVDINIAMWDGEVLFFDVSDNAPTAADLHKEGESGRKDFQEGLFMYPSHLPDSEQTLVCQYIQDCILRMGFRTGTFHCEARVRGSSMRYVRQNGSGIIDLEKNPAATGIQPSIFLIEINCRPPGYFGLYATTWNYGVDLWGLHFLCCINDESRFRALSVPFLNGAQHHSAVLLVMPEKGGILRSEDPGARLRREKPELAACVPLYRNFFEIGQRVTSPEEVETSFTAIVVVESKGERSDLIRVVEELKVEWTPVIE